MKLYSVALLGLLLFLSIETTEPTMSISYNEQVAPGEQVQFSIIIDNTTANICNGGVVFIDLGSMDAALRDYVMLTIPDVEIPVLEPTESTLPVTLALEVLSGAPNGSYDVPVTFEGTLGACDGGCFPFSVTQLCTVEIKRELPEMAYEFDRVYDFTVGGTETVLFSVSNDGMGNASNCNIFVSGPLCAEVVPASVDHIAPQSSQMIAISFDTSSIDPDIYYLNVNVAYYDDYFKLYTEKVPFMVQVRPQNPQITMNILNAGKSVIVDMSNQGGLKAIDISVDVDIDGVPYAQENIDELIPRGALLVPVTLSPDHGGEVPISVTVTYADMLGNSYIEHGEMFISTSENNSKNTYYAFVGIFGMFIVAGVVLALRRKSWKQKE